MRRALTLCLVGLFVAGCAAGGTATPPRRTVAPAPAQGATPAAPVPASPGPSAAASPAARSATDIVLARRGDRLDVLDGGNLQRMFEVPAGVGTPDWLTVYATAPDGDGTRVSRLRIDAGGSPDRQQTIPGHFVPSTIGLAGAATGLSADGRTLVLVDPAPPAGYSRLAILSTNLDAPAAIVSLEGAFTYDTISPDGSRLYLVEHLAATSGGDYAVRSFDVAKRALDPGIVVAKNETGEAMAGTPIEQVVGNGGWVFTLYQGPDGPFVHALSTVDRTAVCLDLPVSEAAGPTLSGWGLAADDARRVVYAVNATLGRVYEIDLAGINVVRSADLATAATPGISLAKFGGDPGSTGTNAALSPDGSTLYVVTAAGLLVVSTGDLQTRGHLLADRVLTGIAVSADGRVLYALDRDGRIESVDAATGAPIGRLQGTGYDAILRIVGEQP